MELKAQYDLNDLLDLVEKDLGEKGFRLVGGLEPVLENAGKLLLTLAIEQFTVTEALPLPAATPAPSPAPVESHSVKTATKKVKVPKAKDLTLSEEKLAAQEAKRAYWRQQAAKKREMTKKGQQLAEIENQLRQDAERVEAGEVVASASVPFHVTAMLANLRN